MIAIDNTLISDAVISEQFVCDLAACKGACCEEGELGAPLSIDEIDQIEANILGIKPFMSPAGLELLEQEGFYEVDIDNDLATTTVGGRDCVFAVRDQQTKSLKCAIEQAHKAQKSAFFKPISCHLYPIRVDEYETYEAVNYHQWSICGAACSLGKSLQVPVYQFLKVPLIRKFGSEWYEALEAYAKDQTKAND